MTSNKELAKLLEIATPGEFRAVDEALLTNYGDESEQYQEYEPEMSALIAAAVNELPRLLREAGEARARIEELELSQPLYSRRKLEQERDQLRAQLRESVARIEELERREAWRLEEVTALTMEKVVNVLNEKEWFAAVCHEEGSAGE